MKLSKTILSSLIICSLLFLSSCKSPESVTPETLPALFIEWRLSSETFDCSQGTNTNTPTSEIILELIRTFDFRLSEDNVILSRGRFSVEGSEIYFDPPIFENSLSGQVKYALNGSDLILTTTETDLNNPGQSCTVRREYKRD